MAALSRHGNEALARPNEGRDAESRSRSEHELRSMLDRLASADLMEVGAGKIRKRVRKCGEVVEQHHLAEPRRAAKLLAGEGPGRVGEADRIRGDGARDGDGRLLGPLGKRGKIGAERSGEALVISAADLVAGAERKRCEIGERKARIGAADVGNERPFGALLLAPDHCLLPGEWAFCLGNAFCDGSRACPAARPAIRRPMLRRTGS